MEKVRSYLELSVILYIFVVSYLVELPFFHLKSIYLYKCMQFWDWKDSNIFHLSALSGERGREMLRKRVILSFPRN